MKRFISHAASYVTRTNNFRKHRKVHMSVQSKLLIYKKKKINRNNIKLDPKFVENKTVTKTNIVEQIGIFERDIKKTLKALLTHIF